MLSANRGSSRPDSTLYLARQSCWLSGIGADLGWDDRAIFRKNYLGRPPDHLVVETMKEAGLV